MANYANLKSAIQQVIKTNGNNEITGALLQQSLLAMINSLGGYYQFAGIATPATNPGTPDQNVFYLASVAGTYSNFGSIVIAENEAAILKYNGTWLKDSSGFATSEKVSQLEVKKVDNAPGKNLFNKETATSGKFITSTGAISSNSSLSITDYIPVTEGQYNLSGWTGSAYQSIGSSSACINLYDANMRRVSTLPGNTQQIAIPSGVAYIRASFYSAYTNIQIERGESRTAYEPYNPITGYLGDYALTEELIKKVDVKPGKNLFNINTITEGKYITTIGTISSNTTYNLSDYIPVEQGQYNLSCFLSGSYRAICTNALGINLYDENKGRISTIVGGNQQLSVPSGVAYIRVSYNKDSTEVQVERGTSRTAYEAYTPIGGYPIAIPDNVVTTDRLADAIKDKVDVNVGKNLFNPSDSTSGKYISSNGTVSSNSSYSVTGYIPVTEGQYNLSCKTIGGVYAGLGSATACINLYDENKNRVSTISGENQQVTIPSGVAFIRASYLNTSTNIQVERGTSRTEYEAYNPIGGYTVVVPDGAITMPKLSQELQTLITNNSSQRFNSCRISGTIAPNEILRTTERYHILKNVLLSAKINGSISKVIIGVGSRGVSNFRDYFAYWVEIDATNVKLYWYNNTNDVLLGTYAHGLTLTSTTVVEILTKQNGNTNSVSLRIFDDAGNIFTQSLSAWGVGSAFVQNVNASGSLDVELSFVPRDVTKKIWLFGDSYISFIATDRWPYYLAEQDLTNFFVNSQPGLSPDNAYLDLQSLLTLGHIPSFLVWTLGMNGATTESQSGGQWVINPAQKTVIDNVVTLCTNANIPLILATVPTVPERQKTGFSNYIRSLGYRYVDFAAAVKCNDAGQWTNGLLSADNVHPSALGAKVLASQILIDFPEIGLSL